MRNLIQRDRPVFCIEVEESHLRRYGTSSKALIEHFLALDYSLLRIKTDWPTDHLALPNERTDLFTLCMQQRHYQTDLLSGSNVELEFENDYYYKSFETSGRQRHPHVAAVPGPQSDEANKLDSLVTRFQGNIQSRCSKMRSRSYHARSDSRHQTV